jgi:hypothetical protein
MSREGTVVETGVDTVRMGIIKWTLRTGNMEGIACDLSMVWSQICCTGSSQNRRSYEQWSTRLPWEVRVTPHFAFVRISQASRTTPEDISDRCVYVLFWSGGKDSYLSMLSLQVVHSCVFVLLADDRYWSNRRIIQALRSYFLRHSMPVLANFLNKVCWILYACSACIHLLSGRVMMNLYRTGLGVWDVMAQARLLGLDLLLVPLPVRPSNELYIQVICLSTLLCIL